MIKLEGMVGEILDSLKKTESPDSGPQPGQMGGAEKAAIVTGVCLAGIVIWKGVEWLILGKEGRAIKKIYEDKKKG
jgi:hypothetical protein